jgi:hypothetical protein
VADVAAGVWYHTPGMFPLILSPFHAVNFVCHATPSLIDVSAPVLHLYSPEGGFELAKVFKQKNHITFDFDP